MHIAFCLSISVAWATKGLRTRILFHAVLPLLFCLLVKILTVIVVISVKY